MKRLLKNSLTAMALICAVAACDKNMVYYSYQHVDSEWKVSDTLFFSVSLRDSLQPMTTEAEVRFDEAYQFNELTLTATHNLMDSTRFVTDTIRIAMTDDTGTRKGSSWSYMYQSGSRLKVVRNSHPGNFTIKIAPLANDTVVKGLRDVGIRMSRISEPTHSQK